MRKILTKKRVVWKSTKFSRKIVGMKKITIITGANSGLGFEFARQLHKNADAQTDEFWLIARNYEKLEESKKKIVEEQGDGAELKLISLDISGKEGVARFRDLLQKERAAREFSLKLLINNAGFGTYGPFSQTPLEKELDMIEVNCTALTGICGECLEFLDNSSRIINVSSLAAFLPLGNFAVYAATKSFVLSFSIALAAELRDKGIKVLALCPGSVSTNFAAVASNGARQEVLHGKDPAKVVTHCLKLSENGKCTAIWAARWKFTAFMSRFIGRYAGARFTFKYQKRPWKN